MMLTSGKMTIDEANGGVVDNEARNNPPLKIHIEHTVQRVSDGPKSYLVTVMPTDTPLD